MREDLDSVSTTFSERSFARISGSFSQVDCDGELDGDRFGRSRFVRSGLRVTLIFRLAHVEFHRDRRKRRRRQPSTSIRNVSRPSFPPPSLAQPDGDDVSDTRAIDSITAADAGSGVSSPRSANTRIGIARGPREKFSAFGSMKRPAWKPVREEFCARVISPRSLSLSLSLSRLSSAADRYAANGGSRVSPASCRLLPKLISR